MKKEYDFSKGKVRRGPIVDPKKAKVQKSIRLDWEVIKWANEEGERTGLGYQTVINQALREAMKKPSLEARVAAIERKLKRA